MMYPGWQICCQRLLRLFGLTSVNSSSWRPGSLGAGYGPDTVLALSTLHSMSFKA